VGQSGAICGLVCEAGKHIRTCTAPSMLPTHSMQFPSIAGPLQSAVMVGQDGALSDDGSKAVCTWTGPFTSDLRIQVNWFILSEVVKMLANTLVRCICL